MKERKNGSEIPRILSCEYLVLHESFGSSSLCRENERCLAQKNQAGCFFLLRHITSNSSSTILSAKILILKTKERNGMGVGVGVGVAVLGEIQEECAQIGQGSATAPPISCKSIFLYHENVDLLEKCLHIFTLIMNLNCLPEQNSP